MNAIVKDRSALPPLKDPGLFRDRAYVDGAWMEADDGRRFASNNPATGDLLGEVADLDAAEARRAIEAAAARLAGLARA